MEPSMDCGHIDRNGFIFALPSDPDPAGGCIVRSAH